MNIPEVATKDDLDWDMKCVNMDMVTVSSIPQECVGVKETLSDKKVTRISHYDQKGLE